MTSIMTPTSAARRFDLATVAGRAAFTARMPRRGRGLCYGMAIEALWPPLACFTRLDLGGHEHLPSRGGVLLAANHLSFADPVLLTAYALAGGRVPRYLAKASLWRVPVVGRVMAGGRHVPVERGSVSAVDAYAAAVRAVDDGQCVVFFPEGTFTDDPAHWPSRGKTGLARVALATGAPVVPVALWGTQRLLPRGAWLPRLLPRTTLRVRAGAPVPLADLRGDGAAAGDPAAARIATARVMAAVTDQLAALRGEPAPAG